MALSGSCPGARGRWRGKQRKRRVGERGRGGGACVEVGSHVPTSSETMFGDLTSKRSCHFSLISISYVSVTFESCLDRRMDSQQMPSGSTIGVQQDIGCIIGA